MKLNIKKNLTYIIAEIGNNHEGSFLRAKKLIQYASKTGVDAVKFQTYKTNEFVSNKEKSKILKKFELSYGNFEKLKKISHSYKLNFISTPLDFESAKFLGKISDAIKISSGDNNFLDMIDLCLGFNKQIIISLGLLNHIETNKVIKRIIKLVPEKIYKKKIIFLHCVSSYPVRYEDANLKRILELKKMWPKLRIGYSDHTLGVEASLVAKVYGAEIIEKHFTLDKNFSKFRDHSLSADVNEMKMIVSSIRKIEKMTSNYSKTLSYDERKNINIIRRHPYATRDIKKSELLSLANTKFLRPNKPSLALNPNFFLGKKIKKKICKLDVIKKGDVI